MRVNEIKEMKEVVVRTEYVAEDGTIFYNEADCKKYEADYKMVLLARYNNMVKGRICECDLLWSCGSEEFYYDIVEIKSSADVDFINQILTTLGGLKLGERLKPLDSSYVGKDILVGRGEDWNYNSKTCVLSFHYFTTLETILESIKNEYNNALAMGKDNRLFNL